MRHSYTRKKKADGISRCFGINLPICVAAVPVLLLALGKDLAGPQPIPGVDGSVSSNSRFRRLARLKIIDVGGQVLFLLGVGLVMLAFTWVPRTYPWNAAAVLVALAIGVVTSVGFFYWEFLVKSPRLLSRIFPFQRPMFPWDFLTQRNIGLLFYINFATGMAIYAVYYFVSLYFQTDLVSVGSLCPSHLPARRTKEKKKQAQELT